jgi:hypothetical protein
MDAEQAKAPGFRVNLARQASLENETRGPQGPAKRTNLKIL